MGRDNGQQTQWGRLQRYYAAFVASQIVEEVASLQREMTRRVEQLRNRGGYY